MEIIMDIIRNKITQDVINDSEIIQDIERVKRKNPGFNINLGCDVYDWPLLTTAVHTKRKELVRYLLRIPNINVNHKSKFNSTALYVCDHVSILKLLLDHKDIDVNIQNKWGETGLHSVCWLKRKACIKEYLLDARVNVLIRDDWRETARDVALGEKYYDIAKIIGNSVYTTLLRIPNSALLHDIVRMIIEEYV